MIKFEEVAGSAHVTWDNVASFNQVLRDTFQVQFELATGNITIVYQQISNVGNNYLVGYTAGGANPVAEAYDLSVDLASFVPIADVGAAPLDLFGTKPVLGGNWDLTTSNIDPASPVSITFFGNGRLDPSVPFALIAFFNATTIARSCFSDPANGSFFRCRCESPLCIRYSTSPLPRGSSASKSLCSCIFQKIHFSRCGAVRGPSSVV